MLKNVANQKVAVFAWDAINQTPKTGDQGNITAQISKDGGACAASNDVNPTQLDAADAPGVYIFDLTQAETNCDLFVLSAVSTTAGIQIDVMILYTAQVQLANSVHGGAAATLTLSALAINSNSVLGAIYITNSAGLGINCQGTSGGATIAATAGNTPGLNLGGFGTGADLRLGSNGTIEDAAGNNVVKSGVDLSLVEMEGHNGEVWYVSKQGNDANGGHRWGDDFLTIMAAVNTAAQGDTIHIGPGTFEEQVNLSGKTGLTIIGAGRRATSITSGALNGAMLVMTGTRLMDLKCIGTRETYGFGIHAGTAEDVRLDRVICYGTTDGCYAILADRFFAVDSEFYGTWDGITVAGAKGVIFDRCIFRTDSTEGGHDSSGLCCGNVGSSVLVLNSRFYCTRNDTSAYEVQAVEMVVGGVVTLINCDFHVSQAGAGTGDMIGVMVTGGRATVKNCNFDITNAGTGATYRFERSGGTLEYAGCGGATIEDNGTINQITGWDVHVFDTSTVEDYAAVESLYSSVAALHHSDTTTNAGYLTIFESDGTTEFTTIAITSSASAKPIVSIG